MANRKGILYLIFTFSEEMDLIKQNSILLDSVTNKKKKWNKIKTKFIEHCFFNARDCSDGNWEGILSSIFISLCSAVIVHSN